MRAAPPRTTSPAAVLAFRSALAGLAIIVLPGSVLTQSRTTPDSSTRAGGSVAPTSSVAASDVPLGADARRSATEEGIALDVAYSELIAEATTEAFFLTPLVDHLPASSSVPSPLAALGHIAGAPEVLTYPEAVHGYIRRVADASPRVAVRSIGESEEGREMIVVIVSSEENMADLDRHRRALARLADPRGLEEREAEALIRTATPVYYATGAIHSPETGSPEMLMELVYRLAVDESPFIRTIRDNSIVLITPIVEVDGRAKQVDLHMARRRDPDYRVPNRLLYWGKYVAHDNNRDGMALSLRLTQNVLRTFLEWNPTVLHDLHESASYLYTSTGRGPYNAWVDPVLINEWARLAYKEVRDMTAFGVPGVYTFDFYDGWAPNYLFWIANMRNSIGRFYETQASRDASNYIVRTSVDREWHRPNTPLPEVVWNIRNNVNLQQSALLIAMHEVASHREEYLRTFLRKSQRSVAKARSEGPAAYVFPADDPRPGQQARLLSLLQRHGIEVHRAGRAIAAGERSFPAGSYVVRLDQPFSRTADMLLDRQYYNPTDPRPYDDVGWTLGPLFNVETVRVEDPAILDAAMAAVEDTVRAPGGVHPPRRGSAAAYLIRYNADNSLAAFRFRHPELRIEAARAPFSANGETYDAGSFLIPAEGNPADLTAILERASAEFGFTAAGVAALPGVERHLVATPRIAVMHTWLTTQQEGWLRLGLDEYGIPYDYVSLHDVRDAPRLAERWDVILVGPSVSNPLALLEGVSGEDPVPWQATEVTPNLGRQSSTADMRGGLGHEGLLKLAEFVREGGTLVTLTSSSLFPVHFGLAPGVSVRETPGLWARGGVYRAVVADAASPLAYGYGESLGIYFNSAPVLAVAGDRPRDGASPARVAGAGEPAPSGTAPTRARPAETTARRSGRGGLGEPDIVQGRPRELGAGGVEAFREANPDAEAVGGSPWGGGSDDEPRARVVLRFTPEAPDLLISGGIQNGERLAGTPTLVDARLGDGHVILFGFNPFWRSGTLGSYALLFNALMHHGNLDAGS